MPKATKIKYIKIMPERKPILSQGNYNRLVSARIYGLIDMLMEPSQYSFNDFCNQFNSVNLIAECFRDGYLRNHSCYEFQIACQQGLNQNYLTGSLKPVINDIRENVIPRYANK